jgi:hypothetical protein
MSRCSDTTAAGDEPEPALADLADEIVGRLQSGEPIDVDAYTDRHPECAGPIRALLPIMTHLIDLGRSLTAQSRRDRQPDHPSS